MAEAQAHAVRHGYKLTGADIVTAAGEAVDALARLTRPQMKLPKPVKMTKPEKEYGMILERRKRDGEIHDYRFQGMSLAYSPDPETGIVLRYKCDWLVIEDIGRKPMDGAVKIEGGLSFAALKLIETKGSGKHAISAAAKLRFKGCKAAWPMFKFEMHQLVEHQWHQVL